MQGYNMTARAVSMWSFGPPSGVNRADRDKEITWSHETREFGNTRKALGEEITVLLATSSQAKSFTSGSPLGTQTPNALT